MATFTASPLTSPEPNVQYNLPADLGAAQQIQQGQNSLTMQAQQVADMQQVVGLRQGLEAGDPQALNQLTVVDPTAAGNYLQARSAQALLPYNVLQKQSAAMAAAAQGVVAAAPADRPAAYQQMLATVRPYGLGQNLPDQYPGDGAIDQIALFGADQGKILNYLQSRPYLSGGAAGTTGANQPGATPAGASVAGGQNNPGNLKNVGGNGFQSFPTPEAGVQATQNQLLIDNTTHGLKTVRQIISSWAPPTDGNNTPAYIQAVSKALNVDPDQPIDLRNQALRSQMASAIFEQEGHPISSQAAQPGAAPSSAPSPGANTNVIPAGIAPGPGQVNAPTVSPTPISYHPAVAPGVPAQGAAPASYTPAAGPNAGAPQPTAVGPAAPGAPSQPTPRPYQVLMRNGQPVTDTKGNQLVQYQDGTQGYVPVSGGPADPTTIAVQAHIKSAADAGYQLQRDPNTGAMVYHPIPGGPADPNAMAQRAAATASASGPVAGGPGATPPQTVGAGPFPLPATNPYAGMANNSALATRMEADKSDAAKVVASDAPVLAKDIQNVRLATQFQRVNATNPTGPRAASDAAMLARSIVPFTPSNAPYQMMGKISNELKVAALPSGMGRLDLPIIQAVAKQQPSTENLRQVNTNITNAQIAAAQRDIDYRTGRAQYVQQFGHLQGFDQMWNDYNNNVFAMSMDASGNVVPNTSATPFTQWLRLRSPGGRYNPALASVPDSQLSGGSQGQPQPQGEPQQPQTQQASANPPPATNANAPRLPQQQQASIAIGQTATGPNGVKMRWDGQQWDATGGGH